MKKISVIVPVYNRETYIEKCLDSIVKQSYKNLEIILVNDGSSDKTEEIALSYKDRLEAGEDRAELEKEYAKVQCSPFNAAAFGYVDDIFEPAATYEKINSALDLLASKRVSKMNKKHTNIPL